MTVEAVMSTSDGTPRLDAVVRPGGAAPDIDGADEVQEFLFGLSVAAGDPLESMSPADGDDRIQALPLALQGTYSWAEPTVARESAIWGMSPAWPSISLLCLCRVADCDP